MSEKIFKNGLKSKNSFRHFTRLFILAPTAKSRLVITSKMTALCIPPFSGNLKNNYLNFNLMVAFFRLPKSEDQITGLRFEISRNGFSHMIGNCRVRALQLVSDVTGNRKCLKKIHTLTNVNF